MCDAFVKHLYRYYALSPFLNVASFLLKLPTIIWPFLHLLLITFAHH